MNEYALSPDEQGLVDATITYYQEQANAEVQAILRAITRARKLDGNWALSEGKLTRQT